MFKKHYIRIISLLLLIIVILLLAKYSRQFENFYVNHFVLTEQTTH